MPRCPHNEAWTLTDLPQGVFASRLRNAALEYHRAAEALFGEKLIKSAPAYFCGSHAIELTLKSFLAASGVSRSEMRKDNHCLECLYDHAREHELNPEGQDYAGVMHHLREYTVLHRYPDFVLQQVITPEDVLISSATMLRATEGVVMRAFLHELGPGKTHEADFFSHGLDRAD